MPPKYRVEFQTIFNYSTIYVKCIILPRFPLYVLQLITTITDLRPIMIKTLHTL
jgi:hypothetical protein